MTTMNLGSSRSLLVEMLERRVAPMVMNTTPEPDPEPKAPEPTYQPPSGHLVIGYPPVPHHLHKKR